MAEEAGSLIEPEASGCPVCGNPDCGKRFEPSPHPEHHPFLRGGYDPDAVQGPPEPAPLIGRRRKGRLRCS